MAQEGEHDSPCASVSGHAHMPPFSGAVTRQDLGSHAGADRVPAWQCALGAERANPRSHVNSHVASCGRLSGHDPNAPCSGATTWQALGVHVACCRLPFEHRVASVRVKPSSQSGSHCSPCTRGGRRHAPRVPFTGALTGGHAIGWHTPVVKLPKWHVARPTSTCPSAHSGVHDCPCSSTAGHEAPTDPFGGACMTHASGEHLAICNCPAVQRVVPSRVYPRLQSMVQVSPCSTLWLQSPTVPFGGGWSMVHASGLHVGRVSAPNAHATSPDRVWPLWHVGVHVSPCAMTPDAGHVPSDAFSTTIGWTQAFGAHRPIELSPNEHVVSEESVVPRGQDGVHDRPCSSTDGQFPTEPPSGALVEHESGVHVGEFDSPNEHVVGAEALYPGSHCTLHDRPCGSSVGQSPIVPLAGGDSGQGRGAHCPIRNVPSVHSVGAVSSYPRSQVGAHDSPCFSWVVHSPTDPWAGGLGTGHDFGRHFVGCVRPKAHDVHPSGS